MYYMNYYNVLWTMFFFMYLFFLYVLMLMYLYLCYVLHTGMPERNKKGSILGQYFKFELK